MKVKKEMLLMDYLLLSYNRKNAKNLLKYKQVYVNNQQLVNLIIYYMKMTK